MSQEEQDRPRTSPLAAASASSPSPAVFSEPQTEGQRRAAAAFGRLYSVIARLRAPDGCPWDKEQSPQSLRGDLVEETYELVEAISENDPAHVAEEAGDVLFHATMIPYMYEQAGDFTVAQAVDGLSDKLVRRHPHVFGEAVAADSEAVIRQWDEIKVKVEGRAAKDSLMDQVPRSLPPLERAFKLQKKAAKAGFDWKEAGGVWDKAAEELAEARESCEAADQAALEEELGDLLFSVVNIARFLKVDPALALAGANDKFVRRFRYVESGMRESGRAMGPDTVKAMNDYWDACKEEEKAGRKS